jgi:hypothetical protein
VNTITAPYNFVPLSDVVFFPDWADASGGLHDQPFADGICGTLDVELTARGPLFVRGASAPTPGNGGLVHHFFKTPDGSYAIPGSSLRGLLRNVVQIASFGKFGPINATRYGFRDLHNPDQYIRHMATIDNRQRGAAAVVPLVGAAWLVRRDDVGDDSDDAIVADLRPCSFAKVEYDHLRRMKPGFEPGRKQSAPEKYSKWRPTPLQTHARLRGAIGQDLRTGLGQFSIVDELGAGLPTPGTLVFTGQPQESRPGPRRPGAGQAKHHDFFFFDTRADPPSIPVRRSQLRDFEFIHSDVGQQGRSRSAPNAEWGYWEPGFRAGQRVPVFYLLDDHRKALRSFGLAMMFRLAYANAIHQLADAHQSKRTAVERDLAELIFGVVPDGARDDDRRGALKGRVSIGLATATEATPTREVVAVLGAPKPTFYPNYIEQGDEPGAPARNEGGKPRYKTYMDSDARLRGWKRYRPQRADFTPPLPEKATEKVKSRFVPLAAGTTFRGRIRIHNLRPVELGALLWAMDFGGRTDLDHMLGMARSLGFGRVALRVSSHDLQRNDQRGTRLDDAALTAAREAFAAWATAQADENDVPGGWMGSAQIVELLACAKPLPEDSRDGKHLNLKDPVDGNQFILAKKSGLALPPAAPWRRPPKVAKPPPRRTVQSQLILNPGKGEWTGVATLDGVSISLTGTKIDGITDRMKTKRASGAVACEIEHVGGNRYRIVRVIPPGGA